MAHRIRRSGGVRSAAHYCYYYYYSRRHTIIITIITLGGTLLPRAAGCSISNHRPNICVYLVCVFWVFGLQDDGDWRAAVGGNRLGSRDLELLFHERA